MSSTVDFEMSQDKGIKNATSTYIDDIYVNENFVSFTFVRASIQLWTYM